MSMSIEDRLFALAQQYSDQRGPAALNDQAGMISQLSSQAPDLHAEIRALAAAFSVDAGARIKAAGNADLEAQGIAGEIAASQKLAMATVTPAIAVARRLDTAPQPTMPPPVDAGWAGDSVVVGTPPPQRSVTPTPVAAQPIPPAALAPPAQPAAQPAAQPPAQPAASPAPAQGATTTPIWQNKWVIGGAAAFAALIAYQNFGARTPDPAASDAPGGFATGAPTTSPSGNPTIGPINPTSPPGPPPRASTGDELPELAAPGGPMPTLFVSQQGQGFLVGFRLRGALGVVVAPQGGWDRGPGVIALARNPGQLRPDSLGGGAFQRVSSSDGPSRLMRVQWRQDAMNVGPLCVAFVGTGGADVTPAGSRFCVLDSTCSQAVACGQMPLTNQPAVPRPSGPMPGSGLFDGMQSGR